MNRAQINYGFGTATLYGDFDAATVERFFMQHANQCFGIRKSIMRVDVVSIAPCDGLPDPWNKLAGAATMLTHSGDTIVWNADGEKIKSEWD